MNEWVEIHILGRVETLYVPFADLSLLRIPPDLTPIPVSVLVIITRAFIL